MEKNPHHLVMGELVDYLTDGIIADTHDERYRQKIAHHLVQVCRYDKRDIHSRRRVTIQTGEQSASVRLDFLVQAGEKNGMMVRFAPGSLVTRRLSNLALSRIVFPYQIPVVVTTNGEDAEIINGITGKVTGHGIVNIPDKQTLAALDSRISFPVISADLFKKASRIAYACEVDGACPCDTDVCIIEPKE